jgi:hypothetical protein
MIAMRRRRSHTALRSSTLDLRSSIMHHPAASDTAAPVVAPATSSMATLLSAHILHDGELVLLILRPSLWFIPLSSLRFIAAVLIFAIAMVVWDPGASDRVYVETAAVLIVARLMFAVLSWMGRLYVLTDMRIVRLSGVFAVDVFDCPLRKIARTRLTFPVRERIVGVGSIDITPSLSDCRPTQWSTVAHPVEVHETVVAAINRARQGGRLAVAS